MIATIQTLGTRRLPDKLHEDEDASLRRAAVDVLSASGYGHLRILRCAVAAGVVTISGFVPSYFLKQMAQEVVLRLAHVRQVKNLVEVRTAVFAPPSDSSPET
jgi:osmotically-inducible protein OsmY